MDTTAKLRSLLGQRRQRSFWVGIVLDEVLAEDLVDARRRLSEARAEAENDEPDEDLRASQKAPDLDELEQAVMALEAQCADLTLEVEFRVADARTYETVLLRHPNAEQDPEARRDFADDLMRTCYTGCTLGEAPVEPRPDFDELIRQLNLSYMEMDEWRTKLLLECMSAPHHIGTRAGHR